MRDELLTSIRLDGETRDLLEALAYEVEGNRSMAVRKLVRAEAERQGLWPKTLRPTRPAHLSECEVQRAT